MKVAEPTSTAAGGAIAAKYGALVGAGAIGAVLMGLVSKESMTRREVVVRGLVAMTGSLTCGPLAVRTLDRLFDWYSLEGLSGLELLEIVIPVYLLVGALSWGVFGGIAKLNDLLHAKFGVAVGDRIINVIRGGQ